MSAIPITKTKFSNQVKKITLVDLTIITSEKSKKMYKIVIIFLCSKPPNPSILFLIRDSLCSTCKYLNECSISSEGDYTKKVTSTKNVGKWAS